MSCDMWFGTKEYAQWIRTPNSGADMSPHGWDSSGTYVNGGGFALTSRNTHNQYSFAWPSTSSRESANLMRSFYEGAFGRGKYFFIDPLLYDQNVLPARLANPSVTSGYEGPFLIPRVNPTLVSAGAPGLKMLPVTSARFNIGLMSNANATYVSNNGVYVPIPEGKRLHLGAFYTSPANAGVYVTPANAGVPTWGSNTRLTPLTASGVSFNYGIDRSATVTGVYLWFGRTATATGNLDIRAVHARIGDIGKPVPGDDKWRSGGGHSGVRFALPPTYIAHTGVNGGQIEYAATFIESEI